MAYFAIWLLGMKIFDLEPVTSAQVVGVMMVVHLVIHVFGECGFSNNRYGGGQADINQPFNFGRQGFPGSREDNDDWSEVFENDLADERATQAARADQEYWIWENPHLEELERDGKD